MPVTQKAIARQLGLTPAAVSMALHNHPRISEETRARVQSLARSLNYTAHPYFSRRASQNRRGNDRPPVKLPALFPGPATIRLGLPLMKAVAAEGAKLGYAVELHRIQDGVEARRAADVFLSRGIEAVLFGPILDESVLEGFPWDRFYTVACEAGLYTPPCHLVLPDPGKAMLETYALCVKRGYRRIGLVQYPEKHDPVDHVEKNGALAMLHQKKTPGVFFSSVLLSGDDEPGFVRWMKRTRPDVVIGQSATTYWWLRRMHVDVPRMVASVTINLHPTESNLNHSGFVIDHVQYARLALEMLDKDVRQFRRGRPETPARMLVTMRWTEGATLPDRSR